MSERLSEEEREALLDVLRDVEDVGMRTGTWEQGRVLAAVEATLTAHDDLWQDKIDRFQLETMEAKADTANWVSAYNQELVLRKQAETRLADQAARLAADEALLRLWDEWDGTRPHPGESSPRQREQLRAALHPDPSDNRPASMFQTPGFDHEDPDLSPQEPRL
jgi:hypothetical protein